MAMNVCPTCGQGWVARARVRRGQIVRVLEQRRLPLRRGRHAEALAPRRGDGRASMRVYWPIVRYAHGVAVAYCPDDFHRGLTNGNPAPPEPYDGLNRHAPPVEAREKSRARARRHRDRQSKTRR